MYQPQSKPRWPAVVGTFVVMLLVGGAVGWFVVQRADERERATAAPSPATSAPAPTTPAAPAVDPTLWSEQSGAFQVSLPAGWSVRSEVFGADQRSLVAQPDLQAAQYDAGFLTVTLDVHPGVTAASALDGAPPSSMCPVAVGRGPFTHASFTGVVDRFSGCPNGFVLWRVAVPAAGGGLIRLTTAVSNDDQTALQRALETFVAPASPSTQRAVYQPCADLAASDDPQLPLSVVFRSTLGYETTYGPLDLASGQLVWSQTIASGAASGVVETREGDVFRFTLDAGPADYVVSSAGLQCVAIRQEGFAVVPT